MDFFGVVDLIFLVELGLDVEGMTGRLGSSESAKGVVKGAAKVGGGSKSNGADIPWFKAGAVHLTGRVGAQEDGHPK